MGVSWFFDREYYEDPVSTPAASPCSSTSRRVSGLPVRRLGALAARQHEHASAALLSSRCARPPPCHELFPKLSIASDCKNTKNDNVYDHDDIITVIFIQARAGCDTDLGRLQCSGMCQTLDIISLCSGCVRQAQAILVHPAMRGFYLGWLFDIVASFDSVFCTATIRLGHVYSSLANAHAHAGRRY